MKFLERRTRVREYKFNDQGVEFGDCELCRAREAQVVCESCDREVCCDCSEEYKGDPEDHQTWLILCDVCWKDLTEPPQVGYVEVLLTEEF